MYKRMYTSYSDKEKYIKAMRAMKEENAKMLKLLKDKGHLREMKRKRLLRAVLRLDIKTLFKGLIDVKTWLLLKRNHKNEKRELKAVEHKENYFSNERIAVYTCIFGSYDSLEEPLVCPDNVDYYIVTDSQVSEESNWKKINISNWEKETEMLSNAEKNRFFKFHPELIFPEYNYSVYIDGKIKIITDVTECINNIGKHGIAMHRHDRRQCVYDELEVCRVYGNDSEKNFLKMKQKYIEMNMPKNYGLCEACVIARKHNDEVVKKIMYEWWKYYIEIGKRDQLLLPLVLFEHGIKPDEIATLGDDVEHNYAFRICGHRKNNVCYKKCQ